MEYLKIALEYSTVYSKSTYFLPLYTLKACEYKKQIFKLWKPIQYFILYHHIYHIPAHTCNKRAITSHMYNSNPHMFEYPWDETQHFHTSLSHYSSSSLPVLHPSPPCEVPEGPLCANETLWGGEVDERFWMKAAHVDFRDNENHTSELHRHSCLCHEELDCNILETMNYVNRLFGSLIYFAGNFGINQANAWRES